MQPWPQCCAAWQIGYASYRPANEILSRPTDELDPVKRAGLFVAMNDKVIEDGVVIPVVNRRWVAAMSHKLKARLTPWDNDFWNLRDWYREA
jgi:hypothetical protein